MKDGKSIKNIIFIFFSSTLLLSCSTKKNSVDLDLSNLPKFKEIKLSDNKNKEIIKSDNKEFIKDLVSLKDKEKVLSKFKYGKKDPFSVNETTINKLSANLKLTGFLSTKVKKYGLVNYLGDEGTISKESIGGVNTDLLPKGAKVVNIDTKGMKLIINYENEDFIFEL